MGNLSKHPICILVVDDHQDTALVLRRALTRTGHQVMIAGSCDEGLAFAKSLQFDLLICDIGLPDGDGCEVMGHIRKLYPIKAIALTGYGMPADIERFSDAGFDAFLLKPVELTKLEAAIDKITAKLPARPAGQPICHTRL